MIDHQFIIQPNAHPGAGHEDAELVPFPERFGDMRGRRHDIVDRSGKLRRAQARPGAVVEKLDFHADVRRVASHGAAQGYAAVAVLGHLVLQMEIKVGVLLLGHEPAAGTAVDIE